MKLKNKKLLERARKRKEKMALASKVAMEEHLKTDEAIAASREKRSQLTRIKNDKIKNSKKGAQPPPPAAPAAAKKRAPPPVAAKKKTRPPPRLLGGAAGSTVHQPSPGRISLCQKVYPGRVASNGESKDVSGRREASMPGNAPYRCKRKISIWHEQGRVCCFAQLEKVVAAEGTPAGINEELMRFIFFDFTYSMFFFF